MSNIKLESVIDDDTDLDNDERAHARLYVSNEITRYAVEILEFYSNSLGRNEALAVTIESLSESLGNLISLVKEEYQQEVVEMSGDVIQQGLLCQQELIAEMTYGQVGHA